MTCDVNSGCLLWKFDKCNLSKALGAAVACIDESLVLMVIKEYLDFTDTDVKGTASLFGACGKLFADPRLSVR